MSSGHADGDWPRVQNPAARRGSLWLRSLSPRFSSSAIGAWTPTRSCSSRDSPEIHARRDDYDDETENERRIREGDGTDRSGASREKVLRDHTDRGPGIGN